LLWLRLCGIGEGASKLKCLTHYIHSIVGQTETPCYTYGLFHGFERCKYRLVKITTSQGQPYLVSDRRVQHGLWERCCFAETLKVSVVCKGRTATTAYHPSILTICTACRNNQYMETKPLPCRTQHALDCFLSMSGVTTARISLGPHAWPAGSPAPVKTLHLACDSAQDGEG